MLHVWYIIFTYIWLKLMLNGGKYSIHGASGYDMQPMTRWFNPYSYFILTRWIGGQQQRLISGPRFHSSSQKRSPAEVPGKQNWHFAVLQDPSFIWFFINSNSEDETIGTTIQGINVSHLGKRKIIFKRALVGDMLVSRRIYILISFIYTLEVQKTN